MAVVEACSKSLKENLSVGKYNSFLAGLLSLIGHPFYWVIWTYVFPNNIDSLFFRLSSAILGLGLVLQNYWPEKLKNFLPLYWFIFVMWILPVTFTYLALLNSFTDPWIVCFIMAVFFVILFSYNSIIGLLNLFLGIFLGCLFFYIENGGALMKIEQRHIEALLPTIFVVITGVMFAHFGRLGAVGYIKQKKENELMINLEREKARLFKSLAGSIAHELRNPLSAIRSSTSTIEVNPQNIEPNYVKNLSRDELEKIFIEESQEVIDHKRHIDKAIDLANAIIDMTLADLSGKKISEADFSYIDANNIAREAIELYAFKDEEERSRVKVNLGSNYASLNDINKDSDFENSSNKNNDSKIANSFIFKGVETAFYYIIFNLIKNALYYVKDKNDLTISISSLSGLGSDILKNSKSATHSNNLKLNPNLTYNILQISDTGPGITPEILSKLFGNFVTSGKAEGTGLGLAFCKRTMIDFGGDIDCESEIGKGTKFNLYFPKLRVDELEIAKKQLKSSGISKSLNETIDNNFARGVKKILIADDQELNLIITRKVIKNLLPDIVIDLAQDGKEALKLVKDNNSNDLSSSKCRYDLIITDIQMPRIDGFEFSKEVRKFNQEVPIIAYTSRVSYKIKQQALDSGIDDYIIKPIPNNALLRNIYKWLINNHNYNYDINKIADSFKGLKILIADDEAINILVLKKFLTKFGIIVEEVSDGSELLEKYKSQFPKINLEDNAGQINQELNNQYDVIITDINMPKKRGDEAVKEIRNFELIYNIQGKAIIIANSGDVQEAKLKPMLKSGMDDYFVKGDDNNKILKIIYFWLNYSKNNRDPSFLNIDNKEYQNSDIKQDAPIINQKLDEEDIRELKDLFIKSAKGLTQKIKEANKRQNLEDLAFQTHALKGISGNMGAQKLFIYISKINDCARRGCWPKEKDWLDNLENIVDEVAKYLKKFKS